MAKTFTFTVSGDAVAARNIAASAIERNDVRLTWSDGWNAVGVHGTESGVWLSSGYHPHFRIDLAVCAGSQDGTADIVITQHSNGIQGGVHGQIIKHSQDKIITNSIQSALQNAGVLVAVHSS